MSKCGSKCSETASLDRKTGKQQMIAEPGNLKYKPGELHPRCDECFEEMIRHGQLMILFDNNLALVEQYEQMMDKKGGSK